MIGCSLKILFGDIVFFFVVLLFGIIFLNKNVFFFWLGLCFFFLLLFRGLFGGDWVVDIVVFGFNIYVKEDWVKVDCVGIGFFGCFLGVGLVVGVCLIEVDGFGLGMGVGVGGGGVCFFFGGLVFILLIIFFVIGLICGFFGIDDSCLFLFDEVGDESEFLVFLMVDDVIIIGVVFNVIVGDLILGRVEMFNVVSVGGFFFGKFSVEFFK